MDIYVITRPLNYCEEGWVGFERKVGRGVRDSFFCSTSYYYFFNAISEMDLVTCGYPGLRWTQAQQEEPLCHSGPKVPFRTESDVNAREK